MKARHWSILLAAVSVAFVLAMAAGRQSLRTVWGDEATYLAMAESLARDGDLRFTESDRDRLLAEAGERNSIARTVILHRAGTGVAYSKPILHALLAAPWTLLLGDFGPLALNMALLAAAAWFGWLFLRRLEGGAGFAGLTLVTFVGASVLLPHVGWRMTDLLQASLSLSGLVLALACLRPLANGRRGWLDSDASGWVGGIFLGLLVGLRLPNLLIAAAAVAALLVTTRFGRAARVVVGALAAFALVALLGELMIGTSSPYRQVRSSFDATSGYPVSAVARDETAGTRFDTHRKTQRMGVVPELRPQLTAYSALYFWIGRHSGLLWYFPAVLALGATALWRPDRVSATLLLAAAGCAAFYLTWWPVNYFGGAAFLGNRYFLAAYPLLLVALPRLPSRAALAASWVLAGLVGASALLSLGGERSAATSQSHTRGGIFPLLPYESTASNIDGRRDRYWAGDLVRFVDSEPRASRETFVLDARKSPAEAMLVTREADSSILLRYRTRGEGLELVVEHRDTTQRFPLAGDGRVLRGSLVVPLGAGWRRHPFAWEPKVEYSARTVRFSLAGGEADASDANRRARFWYGGDPAMLERGFEYKTHQIELPASGTAGEAVIVAARLRNMSPVPWCAAGAFPVSLGYQLQAENGDGSIIEGPRVALAEDLPSGDPVDFELPVTWPAEPGRYTLRVDLVIEDYAWFAARVGDPVAQAVVDVTAGAQ